MLIIKSCAENIMFIMMEEEENSLIKYYLISFFCGKKSNFVECNKDNMVEGIKSS